MTTTNRPDLRTVHVNQAADTAEFCFDKAVANVNQTSSPLDPDQFFLGGYRFDEYISGAAVNVEAGNANCVVVDVLPKENGSTVRDLTSYSYGSVTEGAVINNAGGGAATGNIADSTANLDSTSHNGTAGHTQGPDLASVAVDATHNRLNYVFDQAVYGPSATNFKFLFYDANGAPHWGVVIGTSGNIVAVQFASPADSVTLAQQAVVIRGAQFSEGSPQACRSSEEFFGAVQSSQGQAHFDCGSNDQTTNPTESVPVPGVSGLTARPTLQSAALVPGPTNQIDFTFSLPISAGNADDLVAVSSDGQEEQATGETVISANTVRATFAGGQGLQNWVERVVEASAYGCASGSVGCPSSAGDGAVQSVNPSAGAVTRFNATGGVPVGDNAGAFATGYTTGPDARSVTFNNSTGTVTIQMDQRVDPGSLCDYTPANCGNGFFQLLDNTGTIIDPRPLSASVVNNAPFQSQVQLTYPPGDLARGTQIEISGAPSFNPHSSLGEAACTYFGNQADFQQCAVQQVISPTAGASSFIDPAKGHVRYRWHYRSRASVNRALRAAHRRHHRMHR